MVVDLADRCSKQMNRKLRHESELSSLSFSLKPTNDDKKAVNGCVRISSADTTCTCVGTRKPHAARRPPVGCSSALPQDLFPHSLFILTLVITTPGAVRYANERMNEYFGTSKSWPLSIHPPACRPLAEQTRLEKTSDSVVRERQED